MTMHIEPSSDKRALKKIPLRCDLAVIGGGLAGACCAIAAARAGVSRMVHGASLTDAGAPRHP